jgi:hypothetical protein
VCNHGLSTTVSCSDTTLLTHTVVRRERIGFSTFVQHRCFLILRYTQDARRTGSVTCDRCARKYVWSLCGSPDSVNRASESACGQPPPSSACPDLSPLQLHTHHHTSTRECALPAARRHHQLTGRRMTPAIGKPPPRKQTHGRSKIGVATGGQPAEHDAHIEPGPTQHGQRGGVYWVRSGASAAPEWRRSCDSGCC